MANDVDIRKARYKQMSTQELLELHEAGILGNMAYDLLENELRGRGITVPSRPNTEWLHANVDQKERILSHPVFSILSIKEASNRLNKLSKKNRRKMLLNIFIYYPLSLVIAITVTIALLKFVGLMEDVPIGFIITIVIIMVPIGIWQISQIYRNLLKNEDRQERSPF